jgi:hypothetical protein
VRSNQRFHIIIRVTRASEIDNIHAQDAEDDKVVCDQQQQKALEAVKPKPVPQPLPALEEPIILEASQPTTTAETEVQAS